MVPDSIYFHQSFRHSSTSPSKNSITFSHRIGNIYEGINVGIISQKAIQGEVYIPFPHINPFGSIFKDIRASGGFITLAKNVNM